MELKLPWAFVLRLPESATTPTNSSHISPSSGNPDAGTGEMPTIERTCEGASSNISWASQAR
ncbi:hypothetical protein [Streptomyces sp. NPDC051738]